MPSEYQMREYQVSEYPMSEYEVGVGVGVGMAGPRGGIFPTPTLALEDSPTKNPLSAAIEISEPVVEPTTTDTGEELFLAYVASPPGFGSQDLVEMDALSAPAK